MLDEVVITLVAHNLKQSLQCLLYSTDSCDLLGIEENNAKVTLIKIMVIEKEVEHLIYSRGESLLTLLMPDRAGIFDCQLTQVAAKLFSKLRCG